MLHRKREQGDYQKSPPPEESRTELFLGMISMVFVQGLSNHLLGHLSRDISGNPNSPFTMGNWCLTNAPACPIQPTMPSSRALERSQIPDLQGCLPTHLTLWFVLPPTQPFTIHRHIRGAFLTNIQILVHTCTTLLLNHLFSSLQRCNQSIRRLPNALKNWFPIVNTLGRMNVLGLGYL